MSGPADVVIVEQRAVSLAGSRWLAVAAEHDRGGRITVTIRPMRSVPITTPASSVAVPAIADGAVLDIPPHALPELIRALGVIAARLGLAAR